MRNKLIVGNWKMYGNLSAHDALLRALSGPVAQLSTISAAVCVPYPYLAQARELLASSALAWGAQDLCEFDSGAYTGEVAGAMLKEFGCTYAIVGHSERRTLFGEGDGTVARKFIAAQRVGLTPILCIGETLAEREAGETERVVTRQLTAVIEAAGIGALARSVLAYEPVWAIGTGRNATAEQAQSVHAFVRALLARADATVAAGVRILYGGSMKPGNAGQLLVERDVDGGLVGGASLVADDFLAICRAAVTR